MPYAEFSSYENVHIYLHGPDGELKDEQHIHNLVVTAGKNWLATYLAGTNTSAMIYMAIGTGTTAVAAGDTQLQAENSNPRVVGTQYASQNMYQLTGVFGANNPSSTNQSAVTEAGIFNMLADNTGSMYVHSTFSVVNKQPADTLTIVWQITNS